MPNKSYKASQTDWFFGGDGFLATLGPAIDGTIQLAGNCSVIRRRARSASGRLGMTADGGNLSFQVTMPVRPDAEVQKCIANPEGVLFCHRKDANYAYAIPAVCEGIQITSEEEGVVQYALTFTEGESDAATDIGGSVAGVPTTTAGTRPVSSGEEGYVKSSSGITRITAQHTQVNSTVVVIGSPMVAEGGAAA